MGAFDDLIAVSPAEGGGNAFADLMAAPAAPAPAPKPPKRAVGASEVAKRAGTSLLHAANAYAVAPFVGFARLMDIANNLFGLRQGQESYTDIIGDKYVVPSLVQAERAGLQPGEIAGPVASTVLEAAPELGKFVPDLVMGAGVMRALPAAAMRVETPIRNVVETLRRGMGAGVPAGFRTGVEREIQMREAGVDPLEAGLQGAVTGLLTTGQFALPASAGSAARTLPARVASQAAQGAGLNVGAGGTQRVIENLILPDEAEDLRQPAVSPSTAGVDLVMGALLGPLGGRVRRGGVPDRAALGYDQLERAGLAPLDETRTPYEPAPILDPQEAVKAVSEALFRTPEGAPVAPDFQLIPRGQEAPIGEVRPDVSEVPIPVPPELALEGGGITGGERTALLEQRAARQQARQPERPAVVAVDSQGRAVPVDQAGRPEDQGTVAGFLENELARRARQETEARRAFDIASRQRVRKQSAQDEGQITGQRRDLREARAGGTTTPEGSTATEPETFTFLDVRRDRTGRVTSTGPEVEILGETTVKKGKKDVPAYEVRYMQETEGGGREMVYETVEQTRVTELSRPRQPRFAQDIEETSYAPPRGVGTGPEQPQPRRAAQRITTEPSPDFIPGERRARAGGQATARQGEDVTDLAFERITEGARDAEGVRGDQGQLLEARRVGEGGEAARRGDLQQQAPGQPRGAAQRLDRGEGGRVRAAPPAEEGLTGREVVRSAEETQGRRRPSQGRLLTAGEAAPRDRTADAAALRELAESAGWTERGGMLIRDKDGNPVDRTKWIGAEWFKAMRSSLGRKGLADKGSIKLAVEKYIEGEQLTANEQRTIEHMLHEIDAMKQDAEFAGLREDEGWAADLGLMEIEAERNAQNLYDVDLASKLDEATLERLAIMHENDTEAFMRAVAEEVRNAEAKATDTTTDRPGGEGRAPDEEFALEQQTEGQLRQRADQQRRAEEQRRRVENAPPPEEFRLTGSDRPVDEAEARGQQGLFDQGGGDSATLYANPFGKVLEWTVGDTKRWADSLRELKNAITDLRAERPGQKRNVVTAFLRAAFDSAAADMRAVAKKYKSATAEWVVDQFHDVSGGGKATGETFPTAVRAQINIRIVEMHRLLGDMVNDRDAMKQIAALVRNPARIKPGTKIHDAAAGIRKLLDDTLKYMRDAGVEIGEVRSGYFPREFDLDAIMRDPKGFIDAAARAYRDMGMAAGEAAASAKALHDGLLYGETSTLYRADRGATSAPFLKGRVFGKEVDLESHPLNKFLLSDPALSLTKYFERAVKRAEIARRFGDNFANWDSIAKKIIDEGGGASIEKMRDFIALAAGLRAPGVSNGALRASSIMRTWGALMFLEKATLSSLTEFIVPAMRAGNVLDVGRSLKNTVADLFRVTKDADARRAIAEDLGIVAGHVSSSLAAARFAGGEPMGRLESKVLDRYFKRTGLNQWTDATRVAAVDIGRTFIRRLSKDMAKNGKLTKRYLAELGVPEEQAGAFAKWVLSQSDGMPTVEQMKGQFGDLYRTAVRRFVSQSIMEPSAVHRPGWMNHPLGSIVGQLQSFNYAFWENVVKRNARLAKEAVTGADYTMAERAELIKPLFMMPLLVGAQYAIGEARDAIFGDPERRANETGTEKVIKAASRAVPIAPLDPLINIITAARYNRSFAEAASGPVLGTLARMADSTRDMFFKNSEKTNATERRVMKGVWDVFIEPTINLALFASPVTPLSAAITQAAGSGHVREKLFVEPIAGERQRKKGARPGRRARDSTRDSSRNSGR